MPWNKVLPKFAAGTLRSGSPTGKKVTSRTQAVAIMLSEQRAAKAGKAEYQPSGSLLHAAKHGFNPSQNLGKYHHPPRGRR